MKLLFSAAVSLSLMLAAGMASAAEMTAGDKDCLVFHNKTGLGVSAKWTGPCKDGYADGEGKLQWTRTGTPDGSYEGGMRRGRFHGVGYQAHPSNAQYEGNFVDGQFDGFGIGVNALGDRYDGNWKAGRKHGAGKMVYVLGGSYEGGWRDDQYHGKGVIVYAGGRRAEYQFENGSWPDMPVYPDPTTLRRYALKAHEAETGSKFKADEMFGGYVPYDVGYARMTAEQKKIVASEYPLMDVQDEPPYPLNGKQTIARMIIDASKENAITGKLHLLVKVGPDGKAITATSIGSPSAQITKFAQYVVMLEKYKPGLCAGKPCTMIYPFSLEFGVLN